MWKCAAWSGNTIPIMGSPKSEDWTPLTRSLSRYVYFLETRVAYLESLLQSNDIAFDPPEEFASAPKISSTTTPGLNGEAHKRLATGVTSGADVHDGRDKVDKLLSHASRVAVQGTSDSRFLGSTSGISFARVVFAAVKSSVGTSERGATRPSKPFVNTTGGTSMRDSYFGLHTKPTIRAARFPTRDVGLKLVNLYFGKSGMRAHLLLYSRLTTMADSVKRTCKPADPGIAPARLYDYV